MDVTPSSRPGGLAARQNMLKDYLPFYKISGEIQLLQHMDLWAGDDQHVPRARPALINSALSQTDTSPRL
jgi:hypothetical protein